MEAATAIAEPMTDHPDLNGKSLTLLEQAQAIEITDNDIYVIANDLDAGLTALEREIVETFANPKKKAHEAHKAVVAAETKALSPIKQARAFLGPKIIGWRREQERKRQELQRKLDEEARRREEEERLAQAVALEAEAVISEPIAPPPVVAPSLIPKIQGASIRETWSAEVMDLKALVRAVAAGLVPIQAVSANQVFLNQQARAMKRDLNYPGVRAISDENLSRRL